MLHGDFFFDQATRANNTKVTRGVECAALNVSGRSSRAARTQASDGHLTGDVDLSVRRQPWSFGATLGFAHHRTGAADEPSRSAVPASSCGSVRPRATFWLLRPEVSLVRGLCYRGSVGFTSGPTYSSFAGGIDIFSGQRPRTRDGRNPNAIGVLISNATAVCQVRQRHFMRWMHWPAAICRSGWSGAGGDKCASAHQRYRPADQQRNSIPGTTTPRTVTITDFPSASCVTDFSANVTISVLKHITHVGRRFLQSQSPTPRCRWCCPATVGINIRQHAGIQP